MIENVQYLNLSLCQEIKLKKIKCPEGNYATFVCMSKCNKSAFVCTGDSQQCKCIENHIQCSLSILKNFTDKISQKIEAGNQIKQNNTNIKAYQSILEQMINHISQMKDKLFKIQDFLFFSEQEVVLLETLKKQNYSEIKGKDFFQFNKRSSHKIINTQKSIRQYWKFNKYKFFNFCDSFQKQCCKLSEPIKSIKFRQEQSLRNWLKQETEKNVQRFDLIFKASENQFSSKKFHEKCDQVNNTVSIIKTQFNKLIGGFNPMTWKKEQKVLKKDSTKSAFLFSLSLNQKYKCLDYQRAINCCYKDGPSFGGKYEQDSKTVYYGDLVIKDKCKQQQKSYSNLSTTYNLNNKYKSNQDSYQAFSGQNKGLYFKVQQYEVYKVVFEKT